MNRVLSLPFTQIAPTQLDALQQQHHSTVVTERGTIQLNDRGGIVEMKFLAPRDHLPPGTAVCVWWKGGGFVCATEEELRAQILEAQNVAHQVAQARSHLAAARMERSARLAAAQSHPVDQPVAMY